MKSNLIYSSEVWNISEAEENKANALEMNALKKSANLSRIGRTSNDDIRKKNSHHGNDSILEEMKLKHLIWFVYLRE